MINEHSEILDVILAAFAVLGIFLSCKVGDEIGAEKGRQEICEQVCPTDIARIKNNKCECVIEEVRSPLRIELR